MTMRLGICGAGAWGAALALVCSSDDAPVTLWARNGDAIAKSRLAPRLPGHPLPETIAVVDDLAALASCDAILLVLPARHLPNLTGALRRAVPDLPPLISCAKGFAPDSTQLMHAVLRDLAPSASIGALTGPSFAVDVAAGRPTAVALACEDVGLATTLAQRISRRHFRVYPTDDLTGAELGGVVKNVLAIACGIAAGLELGDSAEAALISRGFAEMSRLGVALGGRPETLSGLAGLGDLVLTCKGDASRNRRFGRRLGAGEPVRAALEAVGTVEGATSASSLARLADAHGVAMPISAMVSRVVAGEIAVRDAIAQLLSRPITSENVPSGARAIG